VDCQVPTIDVGDQHFKFMFKKKFWFNEFTEAELGANEIAFNLVYCQVPKSHSHHTRIALAHIVVLRLC
jgi:hypothetical protein